MDNPEIMSPTASADQLQQRLDSLKHLVVSVLILLIIVSGTLTIFLLRQWQSTRKDLADYKPSAEVAIAHYNKEEAARMDSLISRLTEYGRAHPDFRPVLMKYGIVQATGAAPATAAPQKQ